MPILECDCPWCGRYVINIPDDDTNSVKLKCPNCGRMDSNSIKRVIE